MLLKLILVRWGKMESVQRNAVSELGWACSAVLNPLRAANMRGWQLVESVLCTNMAWGGGKCQP